MINPTPSKGGGDQYKDFLFYDDFAGSSAALGGRKPRKGDNWAVTGAAGAGMTAGGGVLKQAAADNTAGYGYVNHGKVPRKIVGEWQMLSGNFAYPATMAIHKDASIVPMLHGEGGASNFQLRLVGVGPVFLDPLFSLFAANWSALSLLTRYRDELHYDGGKMAAMIKRAANGTILGRQLIYDFRTPDFVGNYSFWETLTNRINYLLATAEDVSDYVWPTINELAGLANPTTSNLNATIFGGTLTNSGTGLTIAGAGYGQGGQLSLGAIATGDKIAFAFDATEWSGTQMEVALLKIGAAETEKSNMVLFSANGRISGTLIASETMANAGLAVVVSSAGAASSVKVSNLQVVKNPPTSP